MSGQPSRTKGWWRHVFVISSYLIFFWTGVDQVNYCQEEGAEW